MKKPRDEKLVDHINMTKEGKARNKQYYPVNSGGLVDEWRAVEELKHTDNNVPVLISFMIN